MTTQEQLDQLNEVINGTKGAQEYRIGNRQIRKPDLAVLLKERDRLEQKLAEEQGGGVFVAAFDRR